MVTPVSDLDEVLRRALHEAVDTWTPDEDRALLTIHERRRQRVHRTLERAVAAVVRRLRAPAVALAGLASAVLLVLVVQPGVVVSGGEKDDGAGNSRIGTDLGDLRVVPDVLDQPLLVAQTQLHQLKLRVQIVAPKVAPQRPGAPPPPLTDDRVVVQSPRPGSPVPAGSTVTLRVRTSCEACLRMQGAQLA